jgi:hypothetical protein
MAGESLASLTRNSPELARGPAVLNDALELVQQSERVLEAKVEETVGDCAYGGGPTRRVFADEERTLTANAYSRDPVGSPRGIT